MAQLVTSLVISSLDYCNSVLAGLPASTRRLCNVYRMRLLDLCSIVTGVKKYGRACAYCVAGAGRSRRGDRAGVIERVVSGDQKFRPLPLRSHALLLITEVTVF